jgi:CCR4-NOT transcription complex subunit 1
LGSPSTLANPASGAFSQNQNLSRIVIAQVFLLLSQFVPVKEDKDRAKWDTQAEQVRKVRRNSFAAPSLRFFSSTLWNTR